MANFYFEIKNRSLKRFGNKYHTTSTMSTYDFAVRSQTLLLHSDRVWCEKSGHVWFVKHRQDPTAEVDMKEFMWIKLKAETIRG